MKITKINEKRIGLNLNPKHENKEPKQKHKCYNKKHEMCKTKIQTNFYCDEIKKRKHRKIE
jgi:hypothetical protein